jgi:predicted nucleic acid-binding protein
MIVVDASVAVKWLFPEKGEAAAHELLGSGEQLAGPSLIRVEVAAAVARKARLGEIDREDAEAALDLWLRTIRDRVIVLLPDEPHLARALVLSIALAHPLQDCLYLALAERLNAPLITADRRFAERAAASDARVRLLETAGGRAGTE